MEHIDLTHSLSVVHSYLIDLQDRICQLLQIEANQACIRDKWEHAQGGGGITCVLSDNAVIEKAGVNFSHVKGVQLPQAATLKRPELAQASFQALGVSIIIHPYNPYVPTTHANVRFIAVTRATGELYWWFGGGFDLTPYYGFMEDCIHWHRMAKQACDPFGLDVYHQFKKNCDEYFYLKHRNEPRGIGGLFFDDLNAWGFERCFAFMKSIGEHFILAYQPILEKRKNHIFDQSHRDFQSYRRGRYVEFNLLYDRGTLFGLQSGGRTESILVSLPPMVAWRYNWKPKFESCENELYEVFLQPREWIT